MEAAPCGDMFLQLPGDDLAAPVQQLPKEAPVTGKWWSLNCCQTAPAQLEETVSEEDSDDSMSDKAFAGRGRVNPSPINEADDADSSPWWYTALWASNASQTIHSPVMTRRMPLPDTIPNTLSASSSVTSPAFEPHCAPIMRPLFLREVPMSEQVPVMKELSPPSLETATKQEHSDGLASSGKSAPRGKQPSNNGNLRIIACTDEVGKQRDDSQAGIGELKRQFSVLRRLLLPDDGLPMPSEHAKAFALLQRGLNVLERHPF